MSYPISFMKSDTSARPDQRNGLRNDLLRFGNIDEYEARGCQVKGRAWEFRGSCVPAEDLHILQAAFADQRAR